MSHRFKQIDITINKEWEIFIKNWETQFGKKPTVESIIFLIGIQESGIIKDFYEKEEKKDLMHVGICTLLTQEGYYKFSLIDDDGWPHFTKIKEFETYTIEQQENILQKNIIKYFIEKTNYTMI